MIFLKNPFFIESLSTMPELLRVSSVLHFGSFEDTFF